VLVARACNPSYSGGRDQENWGSKPPWANSLRDSISKKPITKKKKTHGVAEGVGPEFKPQHCKENHITYGSIYMKWQYGWIYRDRK
jgi:hypothetical protein